MYSYIVINSYASTISAFLYHCCASRAWVQCLVKKLTPVLADIVACLDSYDNLDHLHHTLEKLSREEISPTWTERVWLSVLQLRTVFPAAENVTFACKLPFAWIVWKEVNKAIRESRGVTGESWTTFMTTTWLRCLDNWLSEPSMNMASQPTRARTQFVS